MTDGFDRDKLRRVGPWGWGLMILVGGFLGLCSLLGCQQRVVESHGFDQGLGPEQKLSEKAQKKRQTNQGSRPNVSTSRGN